MFRRMLLLLGGVTFLIGGAAVSHCASDTIGGAVRGVVLSWGVVVLVAWYWIEAEALSDPHARSAWRQCHGKWCPTWFLWLASPVLTIYMLAVTRLRRRDPM